jgi:hypothetical protein
MLNAKLNSVRKTTKLEVLKQHNYSDKWVAIFGRFETRIPPQLILGGDGQPRPAGFGHLGGAPAQLISDFGAGFHELRPRSTP